MKSKVFGLILFISITFLFGLLALPKSSFAQTTTLFSDNFNSSIVQPVDIYNQNYFNIKTGDSDAARVFNGKIYHPFIVNTSLVDGYSYSGLGQVLNPCATVTGVIPSPGKLAVYLLGSSKNIFQGYEYYSIDGDNSYPNPRYHHAFYIEVGQPSLDLGYINIDLTIPHIYSVCVVGNQLTFSIENNIIDQRNGPFLDSYGNIATLGYTGFEIQNSAYITNFMIKNIPPNQPPSVNPISNATLNEGDTYSAAGSFTDTDSTSWTGTVDYGDSSGSQNLSIDQINKTFSLSHMYKEEGTYTVTVKVTDNQGTTGTGTATITVHNAPFTVGAITAPTSPTAVNTAITASATFNDPGTLDTHTASWNWGDGTTTTGTITESNGSGAVTDTHTYSQPGIYTVTLTVTDDDNLSVSSSYQYVVIYNPTGGFMTASGKYNSLARWDMQNTSATGEVRFGVSAQYQTGSTIPTGQIKVNFKADTIDFSGTSFQWLVVNGAKGTVKGQGTINGSGNYTILLSGIDGTQSGGNSLVRVKITDSSSNLIYDTQPGAADTADPSTALTSGNVKVH